MRLNLCCLVSGLLYQVHLTIISLVHHYMLSVQVGARAVC